MEDFLLSCPPAPGNQNGQRVNGQKMNLKEFQAFVRAQKRSIGYEFNLASGNNSFDIKISGTAKMMLGFAFIETDDPVNPIPAISFTFTVNNEIIVQNVNPNFYSYALTDEEFYYYPRPLNGSDQVNVTLNSSSGGTTSFAIFYI